MSLEYDNNKHKNLNDVTNETLNASCKEYSEERMKPSKSPYDSNTRNKSPMASSIANRSKSPLLNKPNLFKANTQQKQNIISTLYPSAVNGNNNSIKRIKKKGLKKEKSSKVFSNTDCDKENNAFSLNRSESIEHINTKISSNNTHNHKNKSILKSHSNNQLPNQQSYNTNPHSQSIINNIHPQSQPFNLQSKYNSKEKLPNPNQRKNEYRQQIPTSNSNQPLKNSLDVSNINNLNPNYSLNVSNSCNTYIQLPANVEES